MSPILRGSMHCTYNLCSSLVPPTIPSVPPPPYTQHQEPYENRPKVVLPATLDLKHTGSEWEKNEIKGSEAERAADGRFV